MCLFSMRMWGYMCCGAPRGFPPKFLLSIALEKENWNSQGSSLVPVGRVSSRSAISTTRIHPVIIDSSNEERLKDFPQKQS